MTDNDKTIELPKQKNEKAVTIFVNTDGGITIEPHGFSNFELPTLFRVAAKTVEKQLGVD